jgi:hypothetical protein
LLIISMSSAKAKKSPLLLIPYNNSEEFNASSK